LTAKDRETNGVIFLPIDHTKKTETGATITLYSAPPQQHANNIAIGIRTTASKSTTKPINKMGFDNSRHPKAPASNQTPRPKLTGQFIGSTFGVAA
jgi:hypothetical protein